MSEQRKPHGPYDSSAQAFADAAPLNTAIHAVDPGYGPMTHKIRAARLQTRVDYLTRALTDAGVQLGEYDRRIAAWLADWETQTLQVLVGWIERAHAAGHCADNLGASDALDAAVQKAAADAAREPGITHHAVMRNGVADAECGTRRFWELMTGAWKDVTCPHCLAALDGGDGGV
jgi:hypothetical protein